MKAPVEADYYELLGLSPGTNQENLRQAYLKMAKKFHPDRNPGNLMAEERFKQISQAYAVLSDPASRSRYDRKRRTKIKLKNPARPTAQAQPRTQNGVPDHSGFTDPARTGQRADRRPHDQTKSSHSAQTKTGTDERAGEVSADPRSDSPFKRRASQPRSPKYQEPAASAQGNPQQRDQNQNYPNGTQAGFAETGSGGDLKRVTQRLKTSLSGGLGGAESRASRFFKRLKSLFLVNPLAVNEEISPGDIVFGLILSPQAAADGTTVTICYQRDSASHHLAVKIPAGTEDGTRLRLTDQGHLLENGSRGDLLLDLSVST
jgi:curved DNA-binding protein CbpA